MADRPIVFVVDDDPGVRDALSLFLAASGYPVRDFPSARAFLDEYDPKLPGCLILDMRMPGMNGLELQEEMRCRGYTIPIIFLSAHGDVPIASRAFRAGAVDFLEKPFNDQTLLRRIQASVELDLKSRAQARWESTVRERFALLTAREREVMRGVIQGLSNKEIARELAVSHRTIDVHRARAMEKMGAHSLPELVTMATVCDRPGEPEGS